MSNHNIMDLNTHKKQSLMEKIAEIKNVVAAARIAIERKQYDIANNLLNQASLIITSNSALRNLERVIVNVKQEMNSQQTGIQNVQYPKFTNIDIGLLQKDLERFIELVKNYHKFYYSNEININKIRNLVKNQQPLSDSQMEEYIKHVLKHDNDERSIHLLNINSVISLVNIFKNSENIKDTIDYYSKIKKEVEQDYNLQEELRYLAHNELGYNSDLTDLKFNIYQKLSLLKEKMKYIIFYYMEGMRTIVNRMNQSKRLKVNILVIKVINP